MRILVASIVDPALSKGGAWTATRGLLRAIKNAMPDSSVEVIALRDRTRVNHRLAQLRALVGAAVGPTIPSKVRFTRNPAVRTGVRAKLSQQRPDLVLVNGSDLLWVLDEIPPGVPVVMVFQNVEHELYAAQIEPLLGQRSMIRRLLLRDLRFMEEAERDALSRVCGAIFVARTDQDWGKRTAPEIDSILVPPLFDYTPRARSTREAGKIRLGWLANFAWWPNSRDLKWFSRNVLPFAGDRVQLHLWGTGSEEAARGTQRTVAHGFVDDARDAFGTADVMIAPAQSRGGVKVKVAESLFNRVPLIATAAALRGLDLEQTAGIRICNDAAEWISFLNSSELDCLASSVVSERVSKIFSPARVEPDIRDFLLRVVQRAGSSPPVSRSGRSLRSAC